MIFGNFPRSIHSTLTYHIHHVYMKHVKKFPLSPKCWTTERELSEKHFQNQPTWRVVKFSCNYEEVNCMLEKCSLCKSSETIDNMKLDCSSDTDSRSETDSSSESACSSSEECSEYVTVRRWQIVEKKIAKSNVDAKFKDAIEMFKDDIKTLKVHFYLKGGS